MSDCYNKAEASADEAAKILRNIMETPMLISVHFEFDIDPMNGGIVEYTIKRFIGAVSE